MKYNIKQTAHKATEFIASEDIVGLKRTMLHVVDQTPRRVTSLTVQTCQRISLRRFCFVLQIRVYTIEREKT